MPRPFKYARKGCCVCAALKSGSGEGKVSLKDVLPGVLQTRPFSTRYGGSPACLTSSRTLRAKRSVIYLAYSSAKSNMFETMHGDGVVIPEEEAPTQDQLEQADPLDTETEVVSTVSTNVGLDGSRSDCRGDTGNGVDLETRASDGADCRVDRAWGCRAKKPWWVINKEEGDERDHLYTGVAEEGFQNADKGESYSQRNAAVAIARP